MKKKHIILLILPFLVQTGIAQQKLPIIKANTLKVVIKDGLEGKTRFWNHLVTSKTPIIYHLAKNQPPRKVTFYTDIDSISFNVAPESAYRFNVVVHQADTCSVILTTTNHQYTRNSKQNDDADTLLFTFNKNKQVIIKGSINNNPQMDFCLDLGARMVCVIGKDLDKTNKLVIDGLMEDESVTGLATEKTSSNNNLKIGKMNFAHVPVVYIDESGFLNNGGGLLGFNLFQNRILEIDFDNQLVLVHKKLPPKTSSYSQIAFRQTTGGLYIPVTINNGKKETTGWYFFDTGADHALAIDSRYARKENLYQTMDKVGSAGIASSENRSINTDIVEVPVVKIANFKIENVPTLLANESNAEADFEDGVIGIGLQSRFNLILDYPNGVMYLKPNKYFNDSFKRKSNKPGFMTTIFAASGILIAVFFIYRTARLKRKKVAHAMNVAGNKIN
jgi:hypothetical protein